MIIRNRRLNGKPWIYLPPASSGIVNNPVAPAITGITVLQPQAIPATLVDSAAGDFIAATFAPIGGTGPFVYEVDPIDTSGFTAYSRAGSRYAGQSDQGWIVVPGSAGSTNTRTLTITDATGASATRTVSFDTSATAQGIYVAANRSFAANCDPFALAIPFALWTGSTVDTTTTVTLTDPSGYFGVYGGKISLPYVSNFPPVGSYPVTLSAPGYASQTITIVVVAAVAGPPYFIQTLSTVSTSILPGTVVGKIVATTPNNTFTLALSDPSGTLGVSGQNVIIATQPANAGAISFSFTVTDQGSNTTASCSSSSNAALTIVTGTTLAANNMSFAALVTTFNNDTFNNAIGAPSVTGVTGTRQWTLVSQTGYNPLAAAYQPGLGSSAPRYQIDASTGAITAPAILSAGLPSVAGAGGTVTLPSVTDTLVISCTDGVNTCTASLNVTVNWAPTSRTIYVGQGMAAAYGANGYETLEAFRAANFASDNSPHSGTWRVKIVANSNPDYYANDTGTKDSNYAARFPYQGPLVLEGVASGSTVRPRLGGPSVGNVAGGSDMRGKGFFVCGHGDTLITNLEISGCHDAITDGSHGVEAIRKDGETYGNLAVSYCYLHDNDNNLLTGVSHGTFLSEYNVLENGGTSYVSSGATHNAYVGEMGRLVFRNNVSRRSNNGHLLKCRAMIAEIYNNRFFDGLSGSASACVDLPFAGQVSLYNNVIEKGAMALAAEVIRYGEEGIVWTTNTLSVHDNTISILTLRGSHYDPATICWFYYGTNTNGVGATVTLSNNAMYLAQGATIFKTSNSPPASTYSVSGTTTLALPPALDTSRPDLSGTLPSAGPLYRHQSAGQDSFVNFDGYYQYQDRDQIRIPSSTAAGTTICNIYATNQVGDQGAGTANPFTAGTTWSFVNTATWDGFTVPWAASGKYSVSANSNGSAVLKVAGALTSGVDWVQLRATAPNGKISDSRYPIIAV